ncbi:MAG: aspartate 1-decarboxylase [Candidatus Binatia bacterium]
MTRKLLRGKIHRATVTGADLDYEGSVTIDRDLMERADLVDHEAVQVWNVTNGERFETYAIPGRRGSGVVCVNGAAAHKVRRGDLVIIATSSWMQEEEARTRKPRVVFVDVRNRPAEVSQERGGQANLRRAFG